MDEPKYKIGFDPATIDGKDRIVLIDVQIYQSDCGGLPRWVCWLGYKMGKWSCLTHGYFRDNK